MLDAVEALDRINAVFGRHLRTRALHAKGGFYEGTFTATPWLSGRIFSNRAAVRGSTEIDMSHPFDPPTLGRHQPPRDLPR